MKTYLRLLSYAKPIEKFAIPYIIFIALYVTFNTLVLVMIGPLLNVLFDSNTAPVAHAAAQTLKEPGMFDLTGWFKYYMTYYKEHHSPWAALQFVCVVLITAVFLSNIFRYLSSRTMENMRVHTLFNLRRAVFNNVMNLHLGFFSNERKGDIISKVTGDVQVVQFTVTGTLQVIFKEPLTIIAMLFALFSISARLTFFSLLVIPVSAFVISRIVRSLKKQAISAQESSGTMISYLDEALSGIKIIKAFNATNFIKHRFDAENQRYSKIIRNIAKRQQLASPTSEALSVTMIAFIMLYGGYLIFNKQKGALNPGDFIAYLAIFSQLMRPAKSISDSFTNIHSGIAAGERVLQLIDEKPAIQDAKDAITVTDFAQGIEFKNVEFSYPNRPVLKKINFTLPKGKTVALVGPSGGGKSTLMDLIPRFIEQQDGDILVDGHNIQHIKVDSLRALMGTVNQESILFNDTIFNNIAFGKPGCYNGTSRGCRAHCQRPQLYCRYRPGLRNQHWRPGYQTFRRAAPAHLYSAGRIG
jgi:subfamily B ATP-binding cassette protein MsbA